jgi:hypothetical protein
MILFLDFDGVLHPRHPRTDRSDEENLYFCYLPRVEKVLRDHPEVRIVVSSDWRLRRTLDELRACFSTDIRERVIGTTELVRQNLESDDGQRQLQVETYLRKR